MKMATGELGFIHNYVPSQTNDHARTLLLLHGTGGDENDLLPLGGTLGSDYNLLSPRGQVLENGLPRFFRRLSEGVFDTEDLKLRTQQLADFTEKASVLYRFDLDKIIVVGFSNGANIGASLLLLFPRLLAGGILYRPMVPIEPESKPDLDSVPILIMSGLNDPIISRQQPETLARMFREAGGDVKLMWQESGHGISSGEVRQSKKWLESLLI
jgi:phospholipase/carboxylesterase/glyoxalase family protein